MKKHPFIGTVRCRWIQEEHIKLQPAQPEIPYLKKEQYLIATFSPDFTNQYILLQKMILGSSMEQVKKMVGINNPIGSSGGSYLIFSTNTYCEKEG